MYEANGKKGLICQSPNETILFKDENNVNQFLGLLKKNNFESLKKLGDLMIIDKCYEKSIYFYENAIKLKNNNILIIAKILSNLTENYIQYGYFTKALDCINKSIDKIKICFNNNKDEVDKKFILKSLLRKLRCFLGLRNFKEAYNFLALIRNNLKNYYKFDEKLLNEFLNINEVKNLIKIIGKGYENYLGKYNIKEMINDEKKMFNLNNGDYINPKLEISFDSIKGIKIIAKENIDKAEYIIVEKAIYICRAHDPNNDFETSNKININSYMISRIEYIDNINNLIKIIKKSPLDYKDFFILYNGENLKLNYEERARILPDDLLSLLNIELIENIFKFNKFCSLRYFSTLNKMGVGLWKYLSLFNHSCLPNTINLGIGDFIIVKANRQIKKGEEINLSYETNSKHYTRRKKLLKNIYNFECDCSLCKIEKLNREKYPNILAQYDEFLDKLMNSDEINERMKIINNFASFLEKNKNILSENELGKGYFELQCYSVDFLSANKFHNLANKYLKEIDIECVKLNINKFFDFCLMLKDYKQISLDNYNKVYKEEIEFNKSYYNFNEDEIKLLINVNLEEKNNEMLIDFKQNLLCDKI